MPGRGKKASLDAAAPLPSWVPAGWYPDPLGGVARYWDGNRWTKGYRDGPLPQPVPTEAPTRANTSPAPEAPTAHIAQQHDNRAAREAGPVSADDVFVQLNMWWHRVGFSNLPPYAEACTRCGGTARLLYTGRSCPDCDGTGRRPGSSSQLPVSSGAEGNNPPTGSGQLIPIDRFEVIQPPIPPTTWAENALFKVGYPAGWYDTTPTEQPIEGNPALIVLRRLQTSGLPVDDESRGTIRCFSSMRATEAEFVEAADQLPEARAHGLQGTFVPPLMLVRADGAPCYSFMVERTAQPRAFQSVPSTITEVHIFHNGELLLMQLESDRELHPGYQQVLATVLGTLVWK